MPKKYGVPYMGSKDKIADELMACLPNAEYFVDLFAGGCAMTHCALLSGKFQKFIANDIDGSGIQLFLNAIAGKYKDEDRWVSREDFFMQKNGDPYVRWCWSFGNDGKTYMYGREIEPLKKALHKVIFSKTPKARHQAWHEFCNSYKANSAEIENIDKCENLTRTVYLERLQSLQSLQSLQRDYQDVEIPENSAIYCDIPYRATKTYSKEKFDYPRFYDWAEKQENIFISEYEMPADRFYCIKEIEHKSTLNDKIVKAVKERLFVPIKDKDRAFSNEQIKLL